MFTLKDLIEDLPTGDMDDLKHIKYDLKLSYEMPKFEPQLGWTDKIKTKYSDIKLFEDVWEAYKLVVNPYIFVNLSRHEISTIRKTLGIEITKLSNKFVISRAYHKL